MRFVAGIMSMFLGVYMSTFLRFADGWAIVLPKDKGGNLITLPLFLVFIPLAYGVYSLIIGEMEVIRTRKSEKTKMD